MTDTPSAASSDSPGGSPAPGGSGQFAHGTGRHEGPDRPPAPSAGTGRHGMAGGAGYPQFEGPGAAQYGSEPVEPPPSVAGSGMGAPHYGQPGTGPGYAVPQEKPETSGFATTPAGGVSPGQSGQPSGYLHSGAQALDIGQSLSYGVERFRTNPGPWLGIIGVGVLIYLGALAIVQIVNPTSPLSVLFLFLVVLVALWLLQAAMVRGALYETDGYPPAFGSFFRFVNAGNVLLTALLAFTATLLASALCLAPGVIVGFLCMFSLHFVIDQDYGPVEAIKASGMLVLANLWACVLLFLTIMLVTFVGVLACGIGLFVAGPVCAIAVTYAYRMLTAGPVARV
ncbi:hypothetical protein [Nocardia rosealba]|uniref:hypothetical protein n=1 Tax=Nocardia rosealba TaxID=2878563 RepID=UPI001CD91A76|nr:hypothetical protein [Nocardia rosealba]MCA2208472.1 hypothetical protein [Nocardia rosealba]